MEDVTNNINNVGKPLKDQEFDLRVTYGELLRIKALAQNPHPQYTDDKDFAEDFKKFFENIRFITTQIEDRWDRKQDDNPLKL